MALSPVMSIVGAKASLDALLDLIDVGGAGTIQVRTGAQPTKTTDANTGTLLGTLTMSATGFANSTSLTTNGLATATANAIGSDTSADNTGTAGHYRVFSGGGTCILQGSVGTATSNMILNTTAITAGDTIACSSFVVTLPCGDGAS